MCRMFMRSKKVGNWTYLQIVENRRESGKASQRVVASLGRLDRLRESGDLDSLIRSAVRFSESVLAVSAYRKGEAVEVCNRRIGPDLVFERLLMELGCKEVIEALQAPRYFRFSLERPSSLRCCIGSSRPARIGLPKNGRRPTPWRAARSWPCTSCTGPWTGWARNCLWASWPLTPATRPAA